MALSFALPHSEVHVPVEVDGEELSLGLVEIGCFSSGKRGQLIGKKQLTLKYWGDQYREPYNSGPNPLVFQMLGCYNRSQSLALQKARKEIDTLLHVRSIPPESLEAISDDQIDYLHAFLYQRDGPFGYTSIPFLDSIIQERDSERLFELITKKRPPRDLVAVRGKMAEFLILEWVQQCLTDDVHFLSNPRLNYFNRRYDNGTEIDGVMLFHGAEPYLQLLSSLCEYEHLRVISRLTS